MSGNPVQDTTAVSLQKLLQQKIDTAISLVKKVHPGDTEDYVTRYVMMVIHDYFNFSDGVWSMVPQILTEAGKFPDLAIERYRTHSDGTKFFLPTVWIEFKSSINESASAAAKQLQDSLVFRRRHMFSHTHSHKGYFIGIKGFDWLFMEYNILITQDKNRIHYATYTHPFDADIPRLEEVEGRPMPPEKPYAEYEPDTGRGYVLDITQEADRNHIHAILAWISQKKHARDLRSVFEKESILAHGVTTSTISASKRSVDSKEDPGTFEFYLRYWEREQSQSDEGESSKRVEKKGEKQAGKKRERKMM